MPMFRLDADAFVSTGGVECTLRTTYNARFLFLLAFLFPLRPSCPFFALPLCLSRTFKVVLDLAVISKKEEVLKLLAEQTSGVLLLATGISNKVWYSLMPMPCHAHAHARSCPLLRPRRPLLSLPCHPVPWSRAPPGWCPLCS